MNAEEAGLVLNVVEIGMLAAAGFFVYERFFSDPGGDQEAPYMADMIIAYRNWGSADMQKFVDKYEGYFEAAQKFMNDNAINDSETLSITEKIGKWMAGGLKGAAKEIFSTFDTSINPDKNDWSSNDTVTKQVYDAVAAQLTYVIKNVNTWKASQSANALPPAKQDIMRLIDARWQNGQAPPLFVSEDIASVVNTWKLDATDALSLSTYASQISAALAYRKPPQQYIAAVDDFLASLYTRAQEYVNGWTPARQADWTSWEDLESYSFMTQLTKLGANSDTVQSCMLNIYQLTNKIYGAPDYQTGVQNALDSFKQRASSLLLDSVAHQSPTCDYSYDGIIALFQSWGVTKKILPENKMAGWATAIMLMRNELYATRWNTPPRPTESQLIGLGH